MATKRKVSLDAKVNALTRVVEKRFAAVANAIERRPTNSSVYDIVENALRGVIRERASDAKKLLHE